MNPPEKPEPWDDDDDADLPPSTGFPRPHVPSPELQEELRRKAAERESEADDE